MVIEHGRTFRDKARVLACALLLAGGLFGAWTRWGAEDQFAHGGFPKVAAFERYHQAITHELWLWLLILPSARPRCFATEVTVCSYADQYAAWKRWGAQSDDEYFAGLAVYVLVAMGGSVMLMKKRAQ